jgi:hypothetical protein
LATVDPVADDDDAAGEASPALALDPLAPEHVADRVLLALRDSGALDIFDFDTGAPVSDGANTDAALSALKAAGDLLVAARLAHFADDGRTQIALTNAGRYWALHGGYLAFLKEFPPGSSGGGGGRQRNPEMEALRAEYMKLRLGTFWWSFGLSIAGFVMSIASVAIALFYGGQLFR